MVGLSGDSGDIPKLEEKLSCAELHSPTLSDCHHSDGDDDDCIDLLAALDISNEANVTQRPGSRLRVLIDLFLVGSPTRK